MDNQQRELQASNQEDENVIELERQLQEAIAAENFFETASGKLWTKLAQAEVNRILKDITSDKYRKDHMGYNNALSDLNAYKNMLRKMQVGGSPIRKAKIQEKLQDGKQ